MNQKTRTECDYEKAKLTRYGPITLCTVSPDNCPYKQSLKLASFESTPVFRCIRDGKVERIIKETAKAQ